MKTTNEKHLEAQLKQAEYTAKIKSLNIEQDRLNIYAWMVYGAVIGAAVMLITI